VAAFDGVSANYSGSLLLSHPGLKDPHFCKSVVLLSAHSKEDGALGVIINRPMNQNLGDLEERFAFGPLAQVPLYEGGPVANDQILLVAWQWLPEQSTFKLYFGIDPERAEALLEEHLEVRAFQGYSGWGEGQLEGEIELDSWIVQPIKANLDKDLEGEDLWHWAIARLGPRFMLDADTPDDPSVN